jgi:hypothetical protein
MQRSDKIPFEYRISAALPLQTMQKEVMVRNINHDPIGIPELGIINGIQR